MPEQQKALNDYFKDSELPKRLFQIGAHNETLSVAVRVSNQNCSPIAIHGWDQLRLQPAFLKWSAIVPQYFITTACY